MPAHWCYHDTLPAEPGSVTLHADEARHATGSKRLREGDPVMLFDGRGAIAEARIETSSNSEVRVRIESVQCAKEDTTPLTLAVALPRGDRAATMVSMITQLGVRAIIPLQCERNIIKPTPRHLERLKRIALEACKQSHNPYLPDIQPPARFNELIERIAMSEWTRCIIAHPVAQDVAISKETPIAKRRDHAGGVLACIGPEGGFTDAEVSFLKNSAAKSAGAEIVSLGDTILRVETAAVALLAQVRQQGEWVRG